jgi:protein ImuB
MFACVFVPDFIVQAILRAEPELRSDAVAVLEGTPPLLTVAAVNEKARACSVESGLTRLQAEAQLSQLKTGWQLRRRSPGLEMSAHAALLDCACAFSLRVEDHAADTVLLDLAGSEKLFGTPQKIAGELARRASDLGLEVNVGIAANPDAAICAARGFAGITVIPRGHEAERLGDLPVDLLFALQNGTRSVEEKTEEETNQYLLSTFERWGVRTFRGLASLPEIAFSERLGQRGLNLQRLARGSASRPLVPAEAPLVFEEAMELEYPIELLEPVAFLLSRLLEQLCARLEARALATNEIRLWFELAENTADLSQTSDVRDARQDSRRDGGATSYERTLHLPVPMQDPKVFLKLMYLDLQAHPPTAPVLKISLRAEPVKPRRSQRGFFLPVTPEPEKLELTLARVNGIVGQGHAGSPELLDTYLPDAFRMKKFSPPTPTAEKTDKTEDRHVNRREPLLALRVFRPPVAVHVHSRENRPLRIENSQQKRSERFNGRTNARSPEVAGDVLWCSGPWRTSGNWWAENKWDREEWDLMVGNGDANVLCRVYRNQQGWFVEGTYD